jgi:hypothetical protein
MVLFCVKSSGQPGIKNFQDILRNLFQPLFEVTNDPSSHPALHMWDILYTIYGITWDNFAYTVSLDLQD